MATRETILAEPALARYLGTDLEPAARLIADALAAPREERNRRDGLAQLAGMLAADINAPQYIPAILTVLEAAWLAGYRVGLVDGMVTLPGGEDGA